MQTNNSEIIPNKTDKDIYQMIYELIELEDSLL